MASPYSNDLRAKFLASYETGDVGLKKLASVFQVSLGWAEKVWKAKRDTGSTDRPVGRPRGFPSRLTPEIRQRLTEQISKHPDATLEEWREWLDKQEDVRISPQRLSAVILEMGLQIKKKSARQRTG